MRRFNCKYPGCPATIDHPGYCTKHQKVRADKEQERHRATIERLNSLDHPGKELYYTAEWRKLRARIIAEHPYCTDCGGSDYLQVDHIVPHRGDPLVFFDPAVLVVRCEECHKRIGMERLRNARRKQ